LRVTFAASNEEAKISTPGAPAGAIRARIIPRRQQNDRAAPPVSVR
jgi:hypothetical protein